MQQCLSQGQPYHPRITVVTSSTRDSVLSERLIHILRITARPIGQEMQMSPLDPGVPIDNKLLSSLPRKQMDLLAPYMTTEQLPQGTVLLEAGELRNDDALLPAARP